MSVNRTDDKTVSLCVTTDIYECAKNNLAKQGLTVSEYIRLSLIKAANNDVHIMSFLDLPEAIESKGEAETGQVKIAETLTDFYEWVDRIDD
ncbi:RelB [Levilactobacillus parabrevis]|uniref:RelB n=1 Tax=Levilactobacillus parabrevis TaxID=357278 RepID=UPI003757EF9E